jgi:hypothetical protein
MVQKTVNLTQGLAFEGQILTNNYGSIRGALRPYFNNTSFTIPYGRVVVKVSGSKTNIQLPTASGTTPEGITIFNDFRSPVSFDNLGTQGYANKEQVSVLKGGGIDVVVWSEVAVDIDDAVFYRHAGADNVNTFLGRFSNVTGANFTAYTNARFITKTNGAGLAVINIGGV